MSVEKRSKMDIFIYFKMNQDVDIDDLEEAVDELLGDKGKVTGRDVGNTGGI